LAIRPVAVVFALAADGKASAGPARGRATRDPPYLLAPTAVGLFGDRCGQGGRALAGASAV